MKPDGPPIGLLHAATAKTVSRGFADALGEEGATVPTWLVLTALMGERWRTQADLARAVGIEGPTLTHHLDVLERAGLVRRTRGEADRRAVQVELTDEGRATHGRLRTVVAGYDRALRDGIRTEELAELRRVLGRLKANAQDWKPT